MSTIAPESRNSRTYPWTYLLRRFQAYRERRSWRYWDQRTKWIDEAQNAPTLEESWIGSHSR